MRNFFRRLARHQVPPSGTGVRVFLAMMLLIGAVVRLEFFEVTYFQSPGGYDKLLGVLGFIAGVAMIATAYGSHRLSLRGRVSAGLAFGVFTSIALSTPSTLGFLTNVLCSLCAITEAITITDEERELQ